MKTQKLPVIHLFILLALLLSACQTILPSSVNEEADSRDLEGSPSPTSTDPTDAPKPTPTQAQDTPTAEPTQALTESAQNNETLEPTSEAEDEDQAEPTSTIPDSVGPENFPDGINPLTGLPVEDPELLDLPPALISISNFPASARPQAGLNSSPITFEIAIGEGMTRFLAMFYGEYPQAISGQTEGEPTGEESDETETDSTDETEDADDQEYVSEVAAIGPIRSGRLPYEGLRSLYTGFLVMASAWEGVATTLNDTTSVFGDDADDINSAMVGIDKLQLIAQSQAEGYPGSNFSLEGLKFSQSPPEGGRTAQQVWVFYSMLNQIQWRYDEDLGAYIRYDIKTDDSGEFVNSTDRLTGDPVSKENLIVIFADHDYMAPTLIDIDLINRPLTKAFLFRDGEVHEIFWTTRFGEYEQETGLMRPMRFVDAEGNPVPLKHGQTWIHVVSLSSYLRESAISDQPFHPIIEQPGSGLWLVRYKGKY